MGFKSKHKLHIASGTFSPHPPKKNSRRTYNINDAYYGADPTQYVSPPSQFTALAVAT